MSDKSKLSEIIAAQAEQRYEPNKPHPFVACAGGGNCPVCEVCGFLASAPTHQVREIPQTASFTIRTPLDPVYQAAMRGAADLAAFIRVAARLIERLKREKFCPLCGAREHDVSSCCEIYLLAQSFAAIAPKKPATEVIESTEGKA